MTIAPPGSPAAATLEDGRPRAIHEQRFTRPDGTEALVDYTVTPLRDGDEIEGATFVFRDVSDRVRAQRRTEAEHAASRVLAEATNVERAAADLVRAVGDGARLARRDRLAARRRRPADAGDVGADEEMLDAIRGVGGDRRTFARGEGLVGEAWASRAPVWVPDVTQDERPRARSCCRSTSARSSRCRS